MKTTMLTSFPLTMVMVELNMFYMFYIFTMVHFSMFRVDRTIGAHYIGCHGLIFGWNSFSRYEKLRSRFECYI